MVDIILVQVLNSGGLFIKLAFYPIQSVIYSVTKILNIGFMVDFRINETLQTARVRKTKLPFYRLVGAVSNCAYAVRLKTAPTKGRKCLFIFIIHHSCEASEESIYEDQGNNNLEGDGYFELFITHGLPPINLSFFR